MSAKPRKAKTRPAPPLARDKPAESPGATNEAIAVLAYEIYLRRSGGNGSDIDDWLQAEHTLNRENRVRKPTDNP